MGGWVKYRVRAALEGSTSIQGDSLEFGWDQYHVRFGAGASGRVEWIEVEVTVPDYRQYLPRLTRLAEDHHALVAPDHPYHQHLIDLLQYFESIGAFWAGVRRIHWDHPAADWVPESDKEDGELNVGNIRVSGKYPDPPTPISVKLIGELLGRRSTHAYLTVPMAFFREGIKEFQEFRYIQAFFNFYFFLEGFFGAGHSDHRVVERFNASPTLRQAVGDALAFLQADRRRWEDLQQRVGQGITDLGVEEIINCIVRLRGRLHHFSVRSTVIQGHPLNQREFEWCAYLVMAICLKLIPRLLTATTPPPDVGRL